MNQRDEFCYDIPMTKICCCQRRNKWEWCRLFMIQPWNSVSLEYVQYQQRIHFIFTFADLNTRLYPYIAALPTSKTSRSSDNSLSSYKCLSIILGNCITYHGSLENESTRTSSQTIWLLDRRTEYCVLQPQAWTVVQEVCQTDGNASDDPLTEWIHDIEIYFKDEYVRRFLKRYSYNDTLIQTI